MFKQNAGQSDLRSLINEANTYVLRRTFLRLRYVTATSRRAKTKNLRHYNNCSREDITKDGDFENDSLGNNTETKVLKPVRIR
jgi:hypothetical protein